MALSIHWFKAIGYLKKPCGDPIYLGSNLIINSHSLITFFNHFIQKGVGDHKQKSVCVVLLRTRLLLVSLGKTTLFRQEAYTRISLLQVQ